MLLSEGRSAVFSADCKLLQGDPALLERELVCVVEQPSGRLEVLKPSEFAKRRQQAEKLATGK